MSRGDSHPVQPGELDELFVPCVGKAADGRVALAVSGGSDSTALMVLFADWLRQAGRKPDMHAVLTIDHGLRAEAAAEARAVAEMARGFGFQHATLVWDASKPATGIQAAARAARYRLMAAHMRAHAIGLLMTAHTREDQAETVLMRLARGSGIDGLAGIAPLSGLEPPPAGDARPLALARPLLGMPKARLRATLAARGIGWVEDPSNHSAAFERPRLRQAGEHLQALGLAAERIALSARRLQRARAALEAAAEAFGDPGAGRVHVDPIGFIRIDRAAFRAAPEEIALRVLMRAVAAAGGSEAPVPMARLEAFVASLHGSDAPGGWTLARATVVGRGTCIEVAREPDREPLPEMMLAPGTSALWDGRFRVEAASTLAQPVRVRALGEDGLSIVRDRVAVPAAAPSAALATLPSFWRGQALIAVPPLGYSADARGVLTARFQALGGYNLALDSVDPCQNG